MRQFRCKVDVRRIAGHAAVRDPVLHDVQRKRDGGTNDPSNLQSLCHSCHSRKTRAEMGEGGIKSLEADEPRPHVDLSRAPAKLRFPQK